MAAFQKTHGGGTISTLRTAGFLRLTRLQVTKAGVRNAQVRSLQILCLTTYDCIALISVRSNSPFPLILCQNVPITGAMGSYSTTFPDTNSILWKKSQNSLAYLFQTFTLHIPVISNGNQRAQRLQPTSRANKWHYLGKGFSLCPPWTSGDFRWQSR